MALWSNQLCVLCFSGCLSSLRRPGIFTLILTNLRQKSPGESEYGMFCPLQRTAKPSRNSFPMPVPASQHPSVTLRAPSDVHM